MAGAPHFDVVLISDHGPDLAARAENVLAGVAPGRVALQLRRKDLCVQELHALALALRIVTLRHGALLFVNDRIDVALAVGADGVQLPENGLAPEVARRLLGPAALIGVSRHDAAGLTATQGASFALLSPVHTVSGKGQALEIAGIRGLCAVSPLPVYALGGVESTDIPALRAAGARGVAVIRAIWSAPDPHAALQDLLAAFAVAGVAAAGVQG